MVERERLPEETDGLRWYTADGRVLYEEWFHCTDLGVQLKPVIARFRALPCSASGEPHAAYGPPPYPLDEETELPPPVNLRAWAAAHCAPPVCSAALYGGGGGGGAPEYSVVVKTGPDPAWEDAHFMLIPHGELFLYQIDGDARVELQDAGGGVAEVALGAGHVWLLPAHSGYKLRVFWPLGGLGLVVLNRISS